MKKNKKRGVALLSVVVLISVVVSFSLVIFTLILNSNAISVYNKAVIDKEILTDQIFADFVDNQVIDETYELNIKIYTSEENSNIKAVVAKRNNSSVNDLQFVGIYDFENSKILAKQKRNFEINTKVVDGVAWYYLADLIKYEEV